MERLGSLEAIAAAKAELIQSLSAQGVAIHNRDDPLVSALAGRTKARVLWYGNSAESDVRGDNVESRGLDGFSFDLTNAGESVRVSTPLPGRHNLHNLLAAAAVGLTEGLSLAEVADALARARPTSRLRVVAGVNGSTIIDDSYNASPISVLAALDLLAETPGRHLALLGDMRELGAAEAEGHSAVGRRAAGATDVLYVTGEKASLIAEAARAAGDPEVHVVRQHEEAIKALQRELRSGDCLLVKASRALELERVVQALER
jgi:UDP-N-acetylmuramoyl-tripeptide--D-alanyl-D-alanine ligase